ncbi:MAG: hypothetical protein R3190_02910 [Thermoanaerobaculia bacterium]|nr:hypothetical protein [Thermoanaerobaculia bacterium]
MASPRPLGMALRGIAALLIAGPAVAQHPGDTAHWRHVSTPAGEVWGDVSEARLARVATDLVAHRLPLLALLGATGWESPLTTQILVFRDREDFATYHRRADGGAPDAAIASAADRLGRIVAFALDDRDDQLPRVHRILAGDVLDQLLTAPPAWLRTGLAATLARLESDPGGVSLADPERPAFAAPARVWSDGTTVPTLGSEHHETVSAALVRYLMQAESGRSTQLHRYLGLLRGGAPEALAFEECFGGPFEVVFAEVRAAATRGYRLRVELPAVPEAVRQVSAAPEDQARVVLGDFIARTTPWNTVAAALHYGEVEDDSPFAPAARRGEAFLHELEGRHDDAIALYAASLERAPGDTVTALRLGWSLLDRFRLEVGTYVGREDPLPAAVARANEAFEAGLAGDGDHPHLLHGLGASLLFAARGAERSLAALDRARQALPNDRAILADWIVATAREGRNAEARRLYHRHLAATGRDDVAARTLRFLLEEDLVRVTALARDGDLEAAESLLRSARDDADPQTRTELDATLEQIAALRRQIEIDDEIDRFESAVAVAREHVQRGDLDAAIATIEPFLDEGTHEEVRAKAMQIYGQINALDRP